MTAPPRLAADSRVLVVGASGSGKSSICRWIFAVAMGRPHHTWRVIVDPQDCYRLNETEGVSEAYNDPTLLDWSQPTLRFCADDDGDAYEELFSEINRRQHVGVWIDEAELVWSGRRRSELRTLYTAGRKEGRMVIACNQHAANIEPAMRSQTEAFIVCQLDRLNDIETIAQESGMRPADLERCMHQLPPRDDGDDVARSVCFLWVDKVRRTKTWWQPLPSSYLAEADRIVQALR